MSFASPVWLLALAALPLAVLALLASRRRARRYVVRFPAVGTLREAAAGAGPSWRRLIPAALLLAALASLAVALARPHFPYRAAVNQASLMLVTDHSGSMAANDVSPSRLAAAVSAANTFINELPSGARVGAIAFSSSPDSVQAPVVDHSAARAIVDAQNADGSTDTGDALALALQLLHGGLAKHPPSAIVLLSDGSANAGVNPLSVAQQAKRERIPIFTVALGTPNGTLPNPNPFSSPVAVPPDPQLMRQIADASGGRAFNAQSADQLSSIYRHLGSQLGSVNHTRDGTYEFVVAGGVLLLLAGAASTRWSGMLP
jgi:Ca-activated chloride channel family protein